MTLEVRSLSTGSLNPYPGNARKHPAAQVKKLAAAIREFGFRVPMLVDGNYTVVAGHGRLQAAKQLGLTTVPCIVLDDLDEEQLRTLRVADNTLALESEWDWPALCQEVTDLAGSGTGLIEAFVDLQAMLAGEEKLPKLDEPAPERDESREPSELAYQVTVFCSSERDQCRVLEQLEGLGLVCKPVIL